ncbi:MAG: ferrochelatase [Thermoplasmata archaeon]|nr:ferrochelatase [Thermoplasmata archaeon]
MSSSENIGILLLDLGEPPEYDEYTYYSFRDYAKTLVDIGLISKEFLEEDRGTVLMDRESLNLDNGTNGSEYLDAWLKPVKGSGAKPRKKPAVSGIIRGSTEGQRYLRNKGRGRGEPDFYEMYGFDVCQKWQMMGGRSPFFDQSMSIKDEVRDGLETSYGKKISVRMAYGMDPVPSKQKQTVDAVIKDFVEKDKIAHLLVAEHFNVFTDVTSDLYLRKKIEDSLKEVKSKIPVSYTNQLGENDSFAMGVAAKIQDEMKILPERTNVMIALSHHGLPPTKVGDYDGEKDSYQENSKRVFDTTRKKIMTTVQRKGRFDVVQVFAREMEHPYTGNHNVLAPRRALDMAVSRRFDHYIEIPYEFPADGVHVLIKLRQSYGIDPPRWNSVFETNFPYKSLKAKITSAYFYPEYKIRAYYSEITRVLDRLL